MGLFVQSANVVSENMMNFLNIMQFISKKRSRIIELYIFLFIKILKIIYNNSYILSIFVLKK